MWNRDEDYEGERADIEAREFRTSMECLAGAAVIVLAVCGGGWLASKLLPVSQGVAALLIAVSLLIGLIVYVRKHE